MSKSIRDIAGEIEETLFSELYEGGEGTPRTDYIETRLREVVRDTLADIYRISNDSLKSVVAAYCDGVVDKSGAMLGEIRDMTAALSKARGEQEKIEMTPEEILRREG
jgi:hypothetical protein